jgi:hypothetical protein
MARIRRCRNCGRPVDDDGYGELVHVETNRYGCPEGDGSVYVVAL